MGTYRLESWNPHGITYRSNGRVAKEKADRATIGQGRCGSKKEASADESRYTVLSIREFTDGKGGESHVIIAICLFFIVLRSCRSPDSRSSWLVFEVMLSTARPSNFSSDPSFCCSTSMVVVYTGEREEEDPRYHADEDNLIFCTPYLHQQTADIAPDSGNGAVRFFYPSLCIPGFAYP